MPSISSLSAGLKLSSTGNTNSLGEIVIGTAGAANPIFNSVYTAAGFTSSGTINSQSGGTAGTGQAAVFTVNPLAQANGTIGMIIAGKALQLYVEYNSLGQFRFAVLPSGIALVSSTGALTNASISSAWYPVGTEHTVGVSYNNAGYITMVVDGDFASSTALSSTDTALMTSATNTGLVVGSAGGASGGASFNGYIGQVVNFRGPLSPTELAAITQDPKGLAASLGGSMTPAATGHLESAFATRGVGADSIAFGALLNRVIGTDYYLETAPGTINATTPIGASTLTVTTIAAFDNTNVAGPGAAWAGNIRPGDFITGPGIPDGDFVTQVGSNTSITLRTPTNAPISTGGVIAVYHAQAVARQEIATSTSPSTLPSASTVPTAAQLGFSVNGAGSPTNALAAGDIVLRLDSIAGVRGGDLVAGGGLPGGYTVYATGILGSTDSVIITPGGTVATAPVSAGVPIYFVNPSSRDAQSINIASNNTAAGTTGYVAGDQIQITAASGSNGATVTRTYAVQASDILSTPALTNAKIANSIVNTNPTIGLYALAQNAGALANQIVMAPMLSTGPTLDTSNSRLAATSTAYTLAPVVVKSLNSAQVNENNVLDALNLSNIPAGTLASSTFQGSSSYTPLVSSAFVNASLANSAGNLLQTTNGAINPGSQTYTGTSNSTTATPILKGPFYTELVSYTAGATPVGVYDVFMSSSFVTGPLRSVGFTLAASSTAASGKIVSLTPSVAGSLSQSNVAADGSNVNFQWVTSTPVTDFTKPIARLTVNNTDPSQSSFSSTISTISINGGYTMDTRMPSMTMVQAATLPSQVYSMTGTVYQQYTKGTSSFDLTANQTARDAGQQVVIPGTDMTYVVLSKTFPSPTGILGSTDTVANEVANSNILLNIQAVTSPITVSSPSPTVRINVVDNLLAQGANTFTFNINVPSNSSNVSFTPSTGVTGVTVTNNGGYLAVSGTYGGGQNTTTPTLGTLTATLNNMMTSVNGVLSGGGTVGTTTNPSKGAQFYIDSALLNGAPATAQSLYFGAAETNSSGTFNLSNLPLGQLTLNVYNNTAQAASKLSNISLNDAMSALTMAAGRGVVTSTAVGSAGNLDVSDFVAADFNKDGRVTAADSLAILQYFVNYSNLNSAPLSYTYFPSSQQGFVGTGKVGIGNSVAPAISVLTTNINAANSTTLGIGGQQTLDIVGVLYGDIVNS